MRVCVCFLEGGGTSVVHGRRPHHTFTTHRDTLTKIAQQKTHTQAFCAAVIGPILVWGWWVMLNHNGGCTPLTPKACLAGWPALPVTMEFRW